MSEVFDLLDRPLLWIPVTWPGLKRGKDGFAEEVEHEIECEVELLDDKEEFLVMFGLKVVAEGEEPPPPVDEFEAFKRLVKNWRRIAIGGVPLEFSDDNIRRVLRLPSFAVGLQAAYMNALAGKVRTREKNSEGSRGNGRAGDSAPSHSNRKPRTKRRPR